MYDCTEFQKRVLYQMAMLSREVADIRRMLDRQSAASYYADDDGLPDVEVARGLMQSVQTVSELNSKCEETNIRQFLVSLLCLYYETYLFSMDKAGDYIDIPWSMT